MTYSKIRSELLMAKGQSWEQMVQVLLAAASLRQRVVRLVFFASCVDNEEYLVHRKLIEQLAVTYFESPRPVISFIAQKPLVEELVLEVHSLLAADINVFIKEVTTPFGHYLRIEAPHYREIIAGGICGDYPSAAILLQSQQVFEQMWQILFAEQMGWEDIVRQWNYLERITDWEGGNQRYQDFNEVRSQCYSSSQWPNGYPAATGIGTQAGGVQIDFNAVKGDVRITALDNDWQRAAHVYSNEVLVSNRAAKGTPKFERGKQLSHSAQRLIYISGTAAIRGEESVAGDLFSQTRVTVENILHLIGAQSITDNTSAASIELLRVYLKREEYITSAKAAMEKLCPGIPTVYLWADVCREELLIEIEGVACSYDNVIVLPSLMDCCE